MTAEQRRRTVFALFAGHYRITNIRRASAVAGLAVRSDRMRICGLSLQTGIAETSGIAYWHLATVLSDFAIKRVAQQRDLLSDDAATVVELRHPGKQFDDE